MNGLDWVLVPAQILLVGFVIASMWRVFEKASQPGWACLIPVFNCYVILKIAGKPGWWLWLMFIPIVNVVITFLAMDSLAQRFGRSTAFALGLVVLPYVFIPMLGFGGSEYRATPPVIVY
jgi:hypothetical protein